MTSSLPVDGEGDAYSLTSPSLDVMSDYVRSLYSGGTPVVEVADR